MPSDNLARRIALLFALSLLVVPRDAAAWLFHEHARIGQKAVVSLAAANQELLSQIWESWKKDPVRGAPLCRDAAGGSASNDPAARDCIHFGTLTAIAADHSCSPADMERTLQSDWIKKIIKEALSTQADLAKTKDPEVQADIWINSHVENELIDKDYLNRASINNSHFLTARTDNDLDRYLAKILADDALPSALSSYATYHEAALFLAHQLATAKDQGDLARRMLLAEAYALHFLQDSFSAGHVVGTWGAKAYRMGTHDYYCEHGVDARSWTSPSSLSPSYSAHGDAHMQAVDEERAAHAVLASLSQVLAAARSQDVLKSDNVARLFEEFDTCKAAKNPEGLSSMASDVQLAAVIQQTPIPSRGEEEVFLPRFRTEVGPFVRFFSGVRFGGAFSGYDSDLVWYSPRPAGALEVGVGFGYGLEGITNRKADGQLFGQVGIVSQAKQGDGLCSDCPVDFRRGGGSRVPARFGLATKIRLPFWVVPGDLVFPGLLIAAFDLRTYEKMAIVSANGGIVPWQRVMVSSIGRLQLILGREFGVNLYGYVLGTDQFCAVTGVTQEGMATKVSRGCRPFTSVELDLPFLEYRPLRIFSTEATSTVTVQLGGTIDFPRYDPDKSPSPYPWIRPSWSVYLRLGFDGRLYLD
jgi:hypothetical protein